MLANLTAQVIIDADSCMTDWQEELVSLLRLFNFQNAIVVTIGNE